MNNKDFQNGLIVGLAKRRAVEQEYILPIGGDELGGVKNGGNVVINEDGTMTVDEEWVELLKTTLAEDVAYVDLVAPEGKKLKKIHIHINTNKAGLSAASKIIILGSINGVFNNSNPQNLTITSNTINTWGYPVFIIEKGALFPLAFSTIGSINGYEVSTVSMGGVSQTLVNNGPWKAVRIKPYTADVVFKAGVIFYAWGVYEDE